MIRRAVLATSLVAFAPAGAALLFAGPPILKPARPAPDRRYLNPRGLVLSPDGRRAYVALSGADEIAEVDLVSGRTLRRLATGKRPRTVRLDWATLTVTDDGPGVLRIRLADGQSQRVDQVPADAAPSGGPAEVDIPTNQKGGGPGRIELSVHHEPHWHPEDASAVTAAVFENHLSAALITGTGQAGRGFGGVLGGALGGALGFAGGNSYMGLSDHEARRALVSSVMANAIIAESDGSRLTTPLDRVGSGTAQPSDIVWDHAFNTVFITAAGSDAILTLNPNGLRSNLKATALTSALGASQAQSSWGAGSPSSATARAPAGLIRSRLPTQSNPRHLALSVDGRTLVASNTLSDSLTVIAVGPAGAQVVKHVPLGGPEPDAARRGEIMFHSARLSHNGRFACSSCHPDGSADEMTWRTPTEDPGFARRTKPLFGVRDTAPYGWRGDSPTLEDRVRKTLTQLHRHTPKRSEVRELVAYLESLDPPAPVPADSGLADAVARGRALFEGRAKCSKCHVGERLCDGKLHDVGTGGAFDTPSLRGVGRRRNLLHTGQASDPRNLFEHFNKQGRHGATGQLSADDWDDLMSYLKTL